MKSESVLISAKHLIVCVDTIFFLLLVTTYTMYYALEHGTRPLPSMSETWDTPPGSYFSRFFLPIVSIGYVGVGFCIYQSGTESELLFNILGGIGVSGVASVADTELPYVHFLFAIMAFFCTDVYIVLLYLRAEKPSLVQGASVALSVLSKVRFVPTTWLGDAALCIFEWVDAVSIYAFLTNYVFVHCPDENICMKKETFQYINDAPANTWSDTVRQ